MSRKLRRELRPVTWMVLEEIVLEASSQDGGTVAHTSARRIADLLAINPSTAAGALKTLRQKGLVIMERTRALGRFGLASYVVSDIEGLTILRPVTEEARLKRPPAAEPRTENPYSVQSVVEQPRMMKQVDAERSAAITASLTGSVVHPPPSANRIKRRCSCVWARREGRHVCLPGGVASVCAVGVACVVGSGLRIRCCW
jgi:hypothetical protein